jgi:hypothetical protein
MATDRRLPVGTPTRFERAANTAWRVIGDETVVVNLASRRIFGLNASGGRVWEALATGADLARLAGTVGNDATPGGDPATREFLDELTREGLVLASGAAPDDGVEVAPETTVAGAVPPRVVWREELLRFGGACGKFPGGGGPCIGAPHRS